MFVPTRKPVLRCGVAVSALVSAICITNLSHASPLAIGAIENVDSKTASVVVLGQRFSVSSATLVIGTKSFAAAKGVSLLAPSALVWVDGEFRKDGSTQVVSLTVLPERNTPGSSELFVAGTVNSASRTGTIKIGALTVDVTATLASVHVGDKVEVLGTQPVVNGVFVATALAPLRAQGVGGTGSSGVGGTGASGVGGTGSSGVGGTGASGVGGTGSSGVGGTGTSGVGGTGLSGVGGTGLSGVGGTGLSGVGGTGLSGVGGTGLSGVGGTGLSGVGGTGAR